MATEKNEEYRREALGGLFNRWDLDGNHAVGFGELMQVLQTSERNSRDATKYVKKFEAQIAQGRQANQRKRGSVTSLKSNLGGTINFSELDGEPSLDPEAFVSFLMGMTAKDNDEEFEDFIAFCKSGVDTAAEQTHGSKMKKDIWKMFQLLDLNHDGFVDLKELEVLLGVESKADRKHMAKWKARLINQHHEHVKIGEEELEHEDGGGKYELQLTLATFQSFLQEYVDHDEERLATLLAGVESAVQEKVQVKYILEFKIQDIMNEIMGDLLTERPRDVLNGIAYSVKRLQRTGKYPKMLPPKKPIAEDDNNGAENKDDGKVEVIVKKV